MYCFDVCEGSTFIYNTYITFWQAYQGNLCLIASRGPSVMTVEKFLLSLWDNHVDEVIMLNNPTMEAKVSK